MGSIAAVMGKARFPLHYRAVSGKTVCVRGRCGRRGQCSGAEKIEATPREMLGNAVESPPSSARNAGQHIHCQAIARLWNCKSFTRLLYNVLRYSDRNYSTHQFCDRWRGSGYLCTQNRYYQIWPQIGNRIVIILRSIVNNKRL
jgi:hypothetical protein